ncbi:MAG: squalene/phytoene synthase family protein [Pseudomonadota bacterium]
MILSPDIIACARIVEQGDKTRFRTVMAAPVAARAVLFPLYAFNVEVSRAPWVTQEPMIAEMRLQWWRDALEEIAEGRAVRAHEVTTPLAALLSPAQAQRLDASVAARRWDVYRDSFDDQSHFDKYIDQTAGGLMWTAAELLGADAGHEGAVRDLAYAAGVASFLRAVPELAAAGRIPLLDGTPDGVRALAGRARARLTRPKVRKGTGPALWPAVGTRAALDAVEKTPRLVGDGQMPGAVPPWRLSLSALTGRVMI